MVTRKDSNQARLKRHKRVRAKISGTAECPRLAVYRSNANISAQIIDDVAGVTLASASTLEKAFEGIGSNKAAARTVGKTLEVVGVGYKVAKQGKNLMLYLGHSLVNGLPQANLIVTEPEGITFEVPNPNTIVIKGINKQEVGQIAAVIRSKRPPEPYHGKGVKYSDEHIRRKAGKAGK